MLDYVLKILLIASSISVHSFQGIFTSLSRGSSSGYEFSIFMSSLLTESFKLVVSFVLFHFQLLRGTAKRYSYSLRDIFLWSIPALLYMIANNLYFVVISISDSPITQQVFGSLEIVVVGLANVVVLKKELSSVQWASLLLLTSSVASIQIAKSGTQQLSIPFLPAFLTVLSSSLAGLAGVVIEKLMKGVKGVSIFQQNIWLNFWGAIFNFISLFLENGAQFPQYLSLQAFNGYALLTVANTVLMGLITVGILKYLSSVVKSFTSSASLVMTSILSSFLLDVELNAAFYLAVVNLSIAIYLYKTYAPPPKKKKAVETPVETVPDAIGDSEEEMVFVR